MKKFNDNCFNSILNEVKEQRRPSDFKDLQILRQKVKNGEYSEALSLAKQCIWDNPDYFLFYEEAAKIYDKLNETQNAYDILLEGYKKSLSKNYICETLGYNLLKRRNYREAVIWWIRGCVLQLNSGVLFNNQPFIYLSVVANELSMNKERDILQNWADIADPRILRCGNELSYEIAGIARYERNNQSNKVGNVIRILCDKYSRVLRERLEEENRERLEKRQKEEEWLIKEYEQKYIEYLEADTLEDAKKLARENIPEAYKEQYIETMLCDGKPVTKKITANTFAEAILISEHEIPKNAKVIEKNEVQIPDTRIIRLSSQTESEATELAKTNVNDNKYSVNKIKLTVPGKKGILGFGKSLNQYEVEMVKPAILEIKYKSKAKISVFLYDTIRIGDQIWMSQNLNVEHYRNGDPIPEAKSDSEWEKAGKAGKAAWCYYNNDPENGKIFAKLYNWYAVNDPRGIAPEGWHVPTDGEWTKLTDYLGGKEKSGGKLKSKSLWSSRFSGATNESGFSGLPGGYRYDFGLFSDIGYDGYWWSSSEVIAVSAWTRNLDYNNGNVARNDFDKGDGLSVRCLRD